jgi:hypothetical protein
VIDNRYIYIYFAGKPEVKSPLEQADGDRRLITKLIFNKQNGSM